jgi:putative ABC transport system permease protein
MDTVLRDTRFGLRMLRKSLGFAAVAILRLALGIGMNAAIFTVIRTVLLKPLQYPDPGRLVRLVLTVPHGHVTDQAFNEVRFDEMRASAQSFTELGAFGPLENFTLSGEGCASTPPTLMCFPWRWEAAIESPGPAAAQHPVEAVVYASRAVA